MSIVVPARVGARHAERFAASATPTLTRTTAGFLAAHDFDDDDLSPWAQDAGSWDTLLSGDRRLRDENAATADRIRFTAIATGAMYVQATITANGTAVRGIGLAARMDPTTEDAYYVVFDVSAEEYWLKKVVAGSQSIVSGPFSDLGNLAINTEYLVRLYCADGEQKWTFHTSSVRSATDTDHDGETDRGAGFYVDEGNGAMDPTGNDFVAMAGYTIVCTGLSTGDKLQIRDATGDDVGSLVAEGIESSGTATVDALDDDLTVPSVDGDHAGWPRIEIRDSGDSIIDSIEPAGDAEDPLVCPGDVLAFS